MRTIKKHIAGAAIALLALTGCSTASGETPNAETTVEETTVEENTTTEENAPAEAGTRENPLPMGSTITEGDWTLTVNSVNLDATSAVSEANVAPEGQTFILANITVTYNGDAPGVEMPISTVRYVTKDGATISNSDVLSIVPEPFFMSSTVTPGASTTGNIGLSVPTGTAHEGLLLVSVDMLTGDEVFVAVQ